MNNLFIHYDIDALSFYINDTGYVKANSIARGPFGKGKADRSQSLLFHEFIQSWVGYELVKVLVTFGLQLITLNGSLKNRSKDLHDIFSYMLTKHPDLKVRANEILDVLFNKTLHSGHWSHVQFGTKKNIFQQNNGILSLVVLTWLHQHQEFFLNEENRDTNGDWNVFGKYTGTATNIMKDTTPLANINFSSALTPNVLTQITKIKQFKQHEEITGVCASLAEWALRILKPNQDVQLNELYKADPETESCVDRLDSSQKEESLTIFKITTTVFTSAKDNIESNTENNNLEGLDTNTKRNDILSSKELALLVNKFLIKSIQKADKQKKTAKKNYSQRYQKHEKTYNATSAFATIMSRVLDKSDDYETFEEMNKDILNQIYSTTEENP
jgi:hypothetical protein